MKSYRIVKHEGDICISERVGWWPFKFWRALTQQHLMGQFNLTFDHLEHALDYLDTINKPKIQIYVDKELMKQFNNESSELDSQK